MATPLPNQPEPADLVRHTKITNRGIALGSFYPAIAVIVATAVVTVAFPNRVQGWFESLQRAVVDGFGWYYVAVVGAFLVFSIWLGVSRFGDVRLGRADEPPEYSLPTWLALVFGAGMGVGLVFWGAAEPLAHVIEPRPGFDGADEAAAANAAMTQSFLHWGLHAWAIYVVVGLALALAVHRRGRPVSIRWALEPLLGDRVRGWLGSLIDAVALIGTVFGVATSIGLGAKQIAAGLQEVGVVSAVDGRVLAGIVVATTIVATVSVVSGLRRGMTWLANISIWLAVAFMVVVLLVGPTLFLLRGLVESFGNYLQNLPALSTDLDAFRGAPALAWQGEWTTFYWGWWISWAPFVGAFIAKVSKGRTVREFVGGVLVVPATLAFLWFGVFGGTALNRQLGDDPLVAPGEQIVSQNVIFEVVGDLPMGAILSVVAVVVVVIFSITPSASGSLVASMLSAGGDPEPPRWTRVLFTVLMGVVAIALLLATPGGSGLVALQTATIVVALPFSFVMILLCVASYRILRGRREPSQDEVAPATSSAQSSALEVE